MAEIHRKPGLSAEMNQALDDYDAARAAFEAIELSHTPGPGCRCKLCFWEAAMGSGQGYWVKGDAELLKEVSNATEKD